MAGSSSGNIWIDTFQSLQKKDLEERYRKRWILQFNYKLVDILTEEQRKKGWKISQTTKFASFTCPKCSHFWNSGRVTLIFHYCLGKTKRGTVLLLPCGQMCRQCSNDSFINPTFKDENVEAILENLILKIRKNCYHEKIDSNIQNIKQRIIRTKPHESDLCEACMMGICNKDQEVF
ncbi:receptor-transporting protein 3-like [Bufo bufo]|uniref:receptor-transporting protein 3-like n=1 Tax=Bufo bufo TaxID=8384 RepID=UPI001ABDAC49|nr:receptor-transporting protein 3-like [Bufo bufo]